MLEALSLRIYGGSLSGGLEKLPLVSVGIAPEGFAPSAPTLIDEPQAWMIVHAQDYTLYALHSREWRTSAGEKGQLLICLFFPPQQRLGEGKSPLTLLNSLLDSFIILAPEVGMLPEESLDNSRFRAIIGRYGLEPRPVLLPIMQGEAPASFCVATPAQLDALMRHSRYEALMKVGRLEIGEQCESTVNLPFAKPAQKPEPKPVAPKPEPVIPSGAKESIPKPEPKPVPVPEPVIPSEAKESIPKPEPKPEPKPSPVIPSEAKESIPKPEPKPVPVPEPEPSPVIPSEAKESIPEPAPQHYTPTHRPPQKKNPAPWIAMAAILFLIMGFAGWKFLFSGDSIDQEIKDLASAPTNKLCPERFTALLSDIDKLDLSQAKKESLYHRAYSTYTGLLQRQAKTILLSSPAGSWYQGDIFELQYECSRVSYDSVSGYSTSALDDITDAIDTYDDLTSLFWDVDYYCDGDPSTFNYFTAEGFLEEYLDLDTLPEDDNDYEIRACQEAGILLDEIPRKLFDYQVAYWDWMISDARKIYTDDELIGSYTDFLDYCYYPYRNQIENLSNDFGVDNAYFLSEQRGLLQRWEKVRDQAYDYFYQ